MALTGIRCTLGATGGVTEATDAAGVIEATEAAGVTEATDAEGARGAGGCAMVERLTEADALRRSNSRKCV